MGKASRSSSLPIQNPKEILISLGKRFEVQPTDHGKTNMRDACSAYICGGICQCS